MNLSLYSIQEKTNTHHQNIQLLLFVEKCLHNWRDTSLKKEVRIKALKDADDVCYSFIEYMHPEIVGDERKILTKIFLAIQSLIKKALDGCTVDFRDAANAIKFIANCIKE